ncbi:LysR family transcriptional regulator [bacterium M00.F.Ca.ET.228.01.1.1]|uniref:Transcriptional regulator, LysR family n=1 Tax=Burkholderia sp. (strain CCGE1003) TaxID=640512 RepID=E1TDX2_BURSG|nr:LysR family transcriptional regulator [Paraburkholderia phenoliruptrix]MBW9128872.1 LysR family transcriptional regulator [Paraburkholderia ginsengiterrae]TGP45873.1 LysR family transcriptional regulator [bacterium M00.F.Ca.ET.228.01.1.1]TGS04214.1 LysR family transcriptional regulator [bacterium M00.F.Ca.ET.191.01.1.1]TGU07166.1 LysR family transcriptional regulator [bacterium M00.F.Ca.ET.155.01.1.1]MBW0448566.1 LysR family transcriptional regulator [Paraburkholderia phenoliruptrix]
MELSDLTAFISVARAGGFRDAARSSGVSASSLSVAVRRLETRLGLRLLNRTTRSVAPTEAGLRLLEKLTPLFSEMEAALDVLNVFREQPSGTLKLNVPASAARIVLPGIIAPFLKAYPDIRVEVVVEDGFVDVLSIGCDAGIRYDERLEKDMIAVPIGPRVERFATAAAPGYLDARGRPQHPRELLTHACVRVQFGGGATPIWYFERDGEVVQVDPPGSLVVRPGAAMDLLIEAAVAGVGVIQLFEDILRPHLDSGALEPILEPWWQRFSGPFLYYPGHRHVPAPLRAFIDFVKERNG